MMGAADIRDLDGRVLAQIVKMVNSVDEKDAGTPCFENARGNRL